MNEAPKGRKTLRRMVGERLAFLAALLLLLEADVLVHGRGLGSGQELSCAYTMRCLPSYDNTHVCESLAIGTSERDLAFRLGQPVWVSRNARYYEPSAGERGPIEVDVDERRKATRFVCHPAP